MVRLRLKFPPIFPGLCKQYANVSYVGEDPKSASSVANIHAVCRGSDDSHGAPLRPQL